MLIRLSSENNRNNPMAERDEENFDRLARKENGRQSDGPGHNSGEQRRSQ